MIYEKPKDFIENIEKGRPILCLDIGAVRIGIAISGSERIIALPHSIYTRLNMSKDLGYLGKFAKDENIAGFVIGLPLNLQGNEGKNCELIRHFANKLYKKTALPVLLQDERMSTASATRTLTEAGMTRKKRHSLDDKLAAGFILQGVLDGL